MNTKYEFPEYQEGMTKEQKTEVNRVRAASRRQAMRDVVDALVAADGETVIETFRLSVNEALTFLEQRKERAKGESAPRQTKADIVVTYFADKVGESVGAADVFFDLDMDPARVLAAIKRATEDNKCNVTVVYDAKSREYTVTEGADLALKKSIPAA